MIQLNQYISEKLNIDKDVKDIAGKVFECLNADELINAEMMVNKDYILIRIHYLHKYSL